MQYFVKTIFLCGFLAIAGSSFLQAENSKPTILIKKEYVRPRNVRITKRGIFIVKNGHKRRVIGLTSERNGRIIAIKARVHPLYLKTKRDTVLNKEDSTEQATTD